MAIGDDFAVAANGNITHVSGSTTYTVLELHRWLQDLADDAAATGNDFIDITSVTPSERSTDNIITLNSPFNIDDDASEYFYDGSISQAGGDTLYSGLVVVGSLASSTTLKIVQNNTFYDQQASPFWGTGLNEDAAANILLRILVKTRDAGADVDGKRARVQARTYGDTYAEFSLTMGLGNSTAAIFTNSDLNNQTAQGTVAAWTINNTEGYQAIDVDNDQTDEYYYSKWDRVTSPDGINDVYEWAKNITRDNTSDTIHTMNGELFRGITHEWDYDNEASGPYQEDETLSWGTGATAGTGILLALYDNVSVGTLWIQLLTGVPPTDGLSVTGGTSNCTSDVNGAVTARTLSPCFLGTSTGTTIIGAFGLGVEPTDLSTTDKLFDLTNTQKSPPNYQTFTVGGLVSTEDRVLVGPKDTGNDFDFDQLSLQTTLDTASETAVVVTTAIPSDTPSSGTIRIELDTGIYRRQAYTSWTGSTFTIASSDYLDPNDATAGNNVMISYIDELADETSEGFTGIYSTDRSLWVRVRDGGAASPIKTFETAATFGAGGGSVTAIRTSDE